MGHPPPPQHHRLDEPQRRMAVPRSMPTPADQIPNTEVSRFKTLYRIRIEVATTTASTSAAYGGTALT